MKRFNEEKAAALWVILSPIIIFSPIIFQFKSFYWGTAGLQFIPWRYLEWMAIQQGEIPLWNPFNGMGAPLIANYQSAFFYPPAWISFVFAWIGGIGWMSWSLTIIGVLHLSWAGFGMFKFMGKQNVGLLGQTISGISFSLCGYLVARMGFFSMIWAAAWFPWILYYSHNYFSKGSTPNNNRAGLINIPFVVSMSFMLLAGHAQLSWYILLFTLGWVIFQCAQAPTKKSVQWAVSSLGISILFAGLITSIQLLPTAELLLNSQRASSVNFETALTYSFWPWRVITMIAPDFFGNPGQGNYWGYANFWEDSVYLGVLPLLLALSTLPKLWKSPPNRDGITNIRGVLIFFWAFALAAFILALGKNTPIFPFLYRYIPTFAMFNAPARYLIWGMFSISVLAGFGALWWKPPTGRKLYWFRLLTAGGFAVTLGSLLAWGLIGKVSPTFIRATAIAGLWGLGSGLLTLFIPDRQKEVRYFIWQVLSVLLISVDLLIAGLVLNPGIANSFYEKQPGSVSDLEEQLNGERIYLSSLDEYQLKFLRFLRFRDFNPIENRNMMRYSMLPNLNILDTIYSVNNFDPLLPNRYARWMESLESLPEGPRGNWLSLMNVGKVETINLHTRVGISFNSIEPSGRVQWFSDCVLSADSPAQALQMVEQELYKKGSITQLIVESGQVKQPQCSTQLVDSSNVNYQITGNHLNQIDIVVETPASGWLVLADTQYPGWKAYDNGKETQIFAANYLFRGIKISSGLHKVSFIYKPISFSVGAGLSLCSIFFMLLLAYRKNRNQ